MRNLYRKSESGAILVVVLGILALLTVMAVSFVFSTRQTMRASEAYMDTVAATDITEVAIAHAIRTLEADKIKRTGDRLNPTVAITETHDSLRDDWRKDFTAPVIVTYTVGDETGLAVGDEVVSAANGATAEVLAHDTTNGAGYDGTLYLNFISSSVIIDYTVVDESGLVAGDEVINDSNGATARVLTLDTANDRLYLNSTSTALWSAADTLRRNPAGAFQVTVASASTALLAPGDTLNRNPATNFTVTVVSVSKHDEVDLDGDNVPDAIWHNYYDHTDNGTLLGRYAIMIQDESSKINVNTGGLQANEGWSVFEISLADGLNAASEAQDIDSYRHGLPAGVSPPAVGTLEYRVNIAGQGDGDWTSSTDYDDDDDNYNRYFYANDGVDNDGDGTIDETDEGLNEPEEFRVLRPYRTDPLDYNTDDDDGDTLIDETNEGDDQPILILEQLEDELGVDLTGFLTDPVSTNFDGSIDTARERRHLISTNSLDRNLNAEGWLRTNMNVMDSIEASNVISDATDPEISASDLFTRTNFNNLQKAANIYDYRDRNDIPTELMDTAGNIFRGVESIRINEVMVRAATNLQEGEEGYSSIPSSWERYAEDLLNDAEVEGAITPRGSVDYLTNDAAVYGGPNDDDDSPGILVTLPNPPFSDTGGPSADGRYPFKLRMRVRSDGGPGLANPDDAGFRVWLEDGDNIIYLVRDDRLGTDSDAGDSSDDFWELTGASPARWGVNSPAGDSTWYVEEATRMEEEGELPVDLALTSGENYIYFEKPEMAGGGTLDVVDIDWFYFTLEPDCEWIELVNIGQREVDVANWTIISEYHMDWSMVETDPPLTYTLLESRYHEEIYEATIEPPGGDTELMMPPPDTTTGEPSYFVFVVDEDDTGDSVSGNNISFDNIWADPDILANTYQLGTAASIYSGWIDFFGNEPLDNFHDNVGSIDARSSPANTEDNVVFNIDVGRISLYDANGILVDSVTYEPTNVEGFSSLQRDYPANPGERLLFEEGTYKNQNFKMRSYDVGGGLPFDYNVLSDGAYDDWQFPWDASINHWSTPAEANNHHSSDPDKRVAVPESSVKNRFFANVGEVGRVPFYNEFLAVIAYEEVDVGDDNIFSEGSTVFNTSVDQNAIVVSINWMGNWMIVRGDPDNRVNTWQKGDVVQDAAAASATVALGVTSVKPVDAIETDGLQFFARLDFDHDDNEGDLLPGDPIQNDTQTQTATIIYVYRNDVAPPPIEHYMIVEGDVSNPVHTWARDDDLSDGGAFNPVPILENRTIRREPTARMLADRFTTAMIDLEAAAGTLDPLPPSPGNYTLGSWPGGDDPEVPTVAGGGSSDFTITWDEDDGVEDGTYAIYSIVNHGSDADGEVAIPLGVETVTGGTLSLEISNLGAAAEEYRFMRAILAPPRQTFGRINVNTASERVLRGLPGFNRYFSVNYVDTTDESNLVVGQTITNITQSESATLLAFDTDSNWLKLDKDPTPSWVATDTIINGGAFTTTISQFTTLPMMVIDARNAEAMNTIGDVYRTSEFDATFTPEIFRNISNLITTRSDIYKIIVLGQAAVDADGNGIIDDDEVTSEKKVEMIYHR